MKKTLISLIAGMCLTGSAKAETIYVPMELFPTRTFQSYIDQARDGDTLSFYQPGGMNSTTSLEEDGIVNNKSLTINGNGYGILGTLTFSGSGNSTLNNTFIQKAYVPNVISVQDDASLSAYNTRFASTGNTIYWNSNGNFNIRGSMFSEPQRFDVTSINLEKIVGNINISENFIGCSHTGIRVNDELVNPKLYILNNTIVSNSLSALRFEKPLSLTTGEIANNSISDNALGISNYEYAGLVNIQKNNLYNNSTDYSQTLSSPTSDLVLQATGIPDDYHLPPMYTEDGSYHLQDTSPLIGKGLYINGVTTWFPNENSVYIGAYAPNQVPEPSTLALLGIGALGIGILRRKQ